MNTTKIRSGTEQRQLKLQQECIPVGCVPPAHWSYLRISSYPMHAPWEQPRTPPLWTEWQTGVKILPCPKLRLRAVIN